MKRFCAYVVGALAFGWLAGYASAQSIMMASGEPLAAPKTDASSYASCCDGCSNGGYWQGDLELTFLRLHRSDDWDDSSENNLFGFEVSPRLTIGYVGANDLGVRIRFWDYDHSARSSSNLFDVDTYNIDFELFQNYHLGKCTSLELSAGARYNDFEMFDGDEDDRITFDGLGIVVGAKVTRQVTVNGAFYARVRHAWLMGDIIEREGDDSYESTLTQFEGGLGYEYTRCLQNGSVLTVRGGFEMQHWGGYDDFDDENEALGFGGFVLGAGLQY